MLLYLVQKYFAWSLETYIIEFYIQNDIFNTFRLILCYCQFKP